MYRTKQIPFSHYLGTCRCQEGVTNNHGKLLTMFYVLSGRTSRPEDGSDIPDPPTWATCQHETKTMPYRCTDVEHCLVCIHLWSPKLPRATHKTRKRPYPLLQTKNERHRWWVVCAHRNRNRIKILHVVRDHLYVRCNAPLKKRKSREAHSSPPSRPVRVTLDCLEGSEPESPTLLPDLVDSLFDTLHAGVVQLSRCFRHCYL